MIARATERLIAPPTASAPEDAEIRARASATATILEARLMVTPILHDRIERERERVGLI